MNSTALHRVYAKSARNGQGAELLTDHLLATLAAARAVSRRIGKLPQLPPSLGESFWMLVEWAALLHDAGKVAEGFQRQLGLPNPKDPTTPLLKEAWGQRHEVLSLAYVKALTTGLSQVEQDWIAYGVAFHHRPLTAPLGQGDRTLAVKYVDDGHACKATFDQAFGRQVPRSRHLAMVAWLVEHAPQPAVTPQPVVLAQAACESFERLHQYWSRPRTHREGLAAVLLQGAVTMADHLSSGHTQLSPHLALPPEYVARLAQDGQQPYDHQLAAAAVRGHLLLRAPTGSGKTEAALAWASANLADVNGQPRVFYVLPYLASINAMAVRLTTQLHCEQDDIGLAHSKAAQTLLAWSLADAEDEESASRKAKARARMTKLFRERLRIGTPYQLMRGALLGPKYTSTLLDATNSLFILDELHAYEPTRFGWLLAMLRLWEELGGRIAVTSATLAAPICELIASTLTKPLTNVGVDTSFAATLRRHRLHLAAEPIDDPKSIDAIEASIARGHSVLVITNTVNQAQELYAALAPVAQRRWPGDGDAAVLLHSRFTRLDRDRIEGVLRTRYATTAARQGGLVVATQVAEVSLDVDFDTGFTQQAPLEALIQRLGRINRVAARPPADVVVHPVTSAAPYESAALAVTTEILSSCDGQEIAEVQIQDWLDRACATGWGQELLARIRQERDSFSANFLDFTRPLQDRSDLEENFDELFDGTEVVAAAHVDHYVSQWLLDPLQAAIWHVPLSYRELARLRRDNRVWRETKTKTWVVEAVYGELGLDLTKSTQPVVDTVL